jgi:hypothetical protein
MYRDFAPGVYQSLETGDTVSHVGVIFDPALLSLWFYSFLSLPLPCVEVQYKPTMCGWEGLGVLSPVGDLIRQEFNTLYLTRFRTYEIA